MNCEGWQTIADYRGLITQDLRLVVGRPQTKIPWPQPGRGGWWPVRTEREMAEALEFAPWCNMLIDCTASNLVQVDPDSAQALAWAKERGLVSESTWLIRSARGIKALYRSPACELPTAWNDKSHLTTDIGNRLCLAPPSIHPSGLRLTWLRGHSPFDVPLDKLATLPYGLLQAWHGLKTPKPIATQRDAPPPGWLGLVFDALVDKIEATGRLLHPSSNGGLTGRCPLHDDHNPSFSIHPKWGWKCFSGCGEGKLTALAARLGISIL